MIITRSFRFAAAILITALIAAGIQIISLSSPVRAATRATDVEAAEVHAAALRMLPTAATFPTLQAQAVPVWPAGGSNLITSPYGYRVHPIYGDNRFHYGLDIGVDQGTQVVAPLAGTVHAMYWNDAVGNVVEIDHGNGVMTRYCHLSAFLTAVGQTLSQGQRFALSGGTGYLSTGPHLHFEVYDFIYSNDAPVPPYNTYTRCYTVDPLLWLASAVPLPTDPALPPDFGRSLPIKDCLGGAMMRILSATASDPAFAPNEAWRSAMGAFDGFKAKMTSGDFNSDGFMDVAMFYDYGNATSGLWIFIWKTDHYEPQLVWRSGAGGWDAARSKIAGGDFTGDGKTDVAVMYDYGNATSGVWVFATGSAAGRMIAAPTRAWLSGRGCFDARRCKIVGGDFAGDDKADIALLYSYNGSTSGIWTLVTSGSTMTANNMWTSGWGCWDANRSKIIAGQFAGDAKSDVAVLYDYGRATSAVWTFVSSSGAWAPTRAWKSDAGSWDAARSKIAAGNFGGDAKTDLAVIYDYGNSTAAIWTFVTAGSTMTLAPVWRSGTGAFDAGRMVLDGG